MKKLKKTSVLPHLDTSHQRKLDGKSRFYLKVRANGVAKLYDITPELYMDKKYWVHEVDIETNKRRKRMRIVHSKGNGNSRKLEQALIGKINDLSAIVHDIESKGNTVSHEQLIMRWRTASANTLLEFMEMRVSEEKSHLSAGTYRNMSSFLNIVRDFDSHVLLMDVNTEWISNFENYLRNERANQNTGEKGLTTNTVTLYFKILKKYLRYATLNELIPRNPMNIYFGDSGATKRFRGVLPTTEKLTAMEIDILHNAYLKESLIDGSSESEGLHSALQAALASIYTGMRISDILQMYCPEKVTVTENHLSLVMEKVKRRITIKITKRLSEIITIEENQPLLNGKAVVKQVMNNRLRKILKRLGIKKYMTWHDLRRTFATQLQANKVDIKRISELLGHTSVKMTERYIQVRSDDLDNAMDSWDSADDEKKEESELIAAVLEMIQANPEITIPEKLKGMLAGRIPKQAGIWKVS